MALYDRPGPMEQWNSMNAGAIPNDVFGVALQWYVNRAPLTTRLTKLPVGSPHFNVLNDALRPRSTALGANYTSGGATLTVGDSTQFDVGDVLLIESEAFLVTAIASATTLTVTGAYAGTSAANHTTPLTVYILTNTRTGAEVNIAAMSRILGNTLQYCQTSMHAYSVGGALQADANFAGGMITPLDRDRMGAMQMVMDDFESACYYGKGKAIAATGDRPAMKGLQTLIATNNVTSPTNASAYKSSDFIRDTMQAVFNGGGQPGVVLVSTDFLTAFAIWGNAALRIDAGSNVFGTSVDLFAVPFLPNIAVVPSPLLRSGTAVCLSLPEVRIRIKRPMIDKPRGSRGDATEGDIIMEGAIELDNESHHAWVQGITTFSA